MRPLLYSINVTLDGCCDHAAIPAHEALQQTMLRASHLHATESIGRADTLLLGRVTYQMMEGAGRPINEAIGAKSVPKTKNQNR